MCGLAGAILKKPISRETVEATMASLKNRVPYLSHKLAEFSFSIN